MCNIVIKIRITFKRENISAKLSKILVIFFRPSKSEKDEQNCKEIFQQSNSNIIGRFIKRTTKITKKPKDVFNKEKLPKICVKVSLTPVPIIGINFPDINLKPFIKTVSAFSDIIHLLVKKPEYTNEKKPKTVITIFFIILNSLSLKLSLLSEDIMFKESIEEIKGIKTFSTKNVIAVFKYQNELLYVYAKP